MHVCLKLLLVFLAGQVLVWGHNFGDVEKRFDDSIRISEDGDLIMDDILVKQTNKRNMLQDDSDRWERGVVPYVISTDFDEWQREQLLKAMRRMEEKVNTPNKPKCIQHIPRTDQKDYIEIVKKDGCYAAVGRVGAGRQTVSLGRGCMIIGKIMHELTHNLGFEHEQTRPDRDDYIDIDWSNIGEYDKYNYQTAGNQRTLNTSYDFESIMHYGPSYLAINWKKPAWTPKKPLPYALIPGQRYGYSQGDVLKIQRLYGCYEDTSRVYVAKRPDYCGFRATSSCRLNNDRTDDFDWEFSYKSLFSTPLGHSGKKARLMTTVSFPGANELCVTAKLKMTGNQTKLMVRITDGTGTVIKNQTFNAPNFERYRTVEMTTEVNGQSNLTVTFTAAPVGEKGSVVLDRIEIKKDSC